MGDTFQNNENLKLFLSQWNEYSVENKNTSKSEK